MSAFKVLREISSFIFFSSKKQATPTPGIYSVHIKVSITNLWKMSGFFLKKGKNKVTLRKKSRPVISQFFIYSHAKNNLTFKNMQKFS